MALDAESRELLLQTIRRFVAERLRQPGFRSAFGANVGIGSQGLVMAGTEAQKATYLPGIVVIARETLKRGG